MPSILRRLEDRTAGAPDRLLYAFLDLNGRVSERYSYESFLRRVKIIAGHLRRERRLGTNDRVLLAYPPGLEMICAFFACAHAGLIPVPVYPPSSHEFRSALYKMAHIARDCQASAVLTSRDYFSALTANLARSRVPTSPLTTSDIFKLGWIVTEDFVDTAGTDTCSATAEILFLQYTSGSTSDPKGVMVTHENVLHNCELVAEHAGPVAVSWLPQYHDMGLIGYYLYAALSGGTTYGFSPMDFIQRTIDGMSGVSNANGTRVIRPGAVGACPERPRAPPRHGPIARQQGDRFHPHRSAVRMAEVRRPEYALVTFLFSRREVRSAGHHPNAP